MVCELEVKGILELLRSNATKINSCRNGNQKERKTSFFSLWTCVYEWSAKQFDWETDNVW